MVASVGKGRGYVRRRYMDYEEYRKKYYTDPVPTLALPLREKMMGVLIVGITQSPHPTPGNVRNLRFRLGEAALLPPGFIIS